MTTAAQVLVQDGFIMGSSGEDSDTETGMSFAFVCCDGR